MQRLSVSVVECCRNVAMSAAGHPPPVEQTQEPARPQATTQVGGRHAGRNVGRRHPRPAAVVAAVRGGVVGFGRGVAIVRWTTIAAFSQGRNVAK